MWLQSLFDTSGFEVWSPELHNSGIGRAYNPPDAQVLCSVFNGRRRNILQISWDLNVQPCTFDFNASMKLGNLRTQSIAEILNGEPYRALALAQSTGDLSRYPVCANCDRKRDIIQNPVIEQRGKCSPPRLKLAQLIQLTDWRASSQGLAAVRHFDPANDCSGSQHALPRSNGPSVLDSNILTLDMIYFGKASSRMSVCTKPLLVVLILLPA